MTGPPRHGEGQPWWHRPGGAQTPGRPPGYPPPQRPPVAPSQPPRHYGPPPHAPTQRAPVQPPMAPGAAATTTMAAGASGATVATGSATATAMATGSAGTTARFTSARQTEGVAECDDRGSGRCDRLFGGLAFVGGLWFSGYFDGGTGTVLDIRKAEAGVQQILSDPINGYGANDVTAVKCNGGKNPKSKPARASRVRWPSTARSDKCRWSSATTPAPSRSTDRGSQRN